MEQNPEILVVGAGLTGLLLTHRLAKAGKSVALVEARDHLGGRFRRPSTPEIYPATDDVARLLEWVRSVSPTPLSLGTRDHAPKMFDDGRLRAFAGFGETDFRSAAELGAFGAPSEFSVGPGFDQLVRALVEQLPVVAETQGEVTAMTVVGKRIESVTLNGDKAIRPGLVVFTAHPPLLNALVPGAGLRDKTRARLAKTRTWTSVNLELRSPKPLTDEPTTLVFNHNAREFEPVVGRTFGERSIWMTLVPDELEADVEFTGQNIRQIKRQLKRLFATEALGTEETIFVHPHAYGQVALKTKDRFRFGEIENLVCAGHALSAHPGALGAIDVARGVEEVLLPTAPGAPDLPDPSL